MAAASTPRRDSAGAGAVGCEHSPALPGLLHDCPDGQEACAQQVSSTQLPDMQTAISLHAPPFGTSVGVGVALAVLVAVADAVFVGVPVWVCVGVAVSVAVSVGVFVGFDRATDSRCREGDGEGADTTAAVTGSVPGPPLVYPPSAAPAHAAVTSLAPSALMRGGPVNG